MRCNGERRGISNTIPIQRNNKDNKEQKLGQHDLLWKLGMREGTQELWTSPDTYMVTAMHCKSLKCIYINLTIMNSTTIQEQRTWCTWSLVK